MTFEDIDFLIIGATKSATTWLQKSLQADPNILMPDPELHYFSREFHRGDGWYFRQFPAGSSGSLIGEKSNSYLESAAAAERIATKLPHAKLIVQLRNPVDRAYSDYCMMYRRGEVGRNIEDYLDPRRRQNTRLISAGYYFQQLRLYYDLFPADQIFLTLYESIWTEPQAHLASVRRHLGLDPQQAPAMVQRKVKDKKEPQLGPELRRVLRPLKQVVAPLRPNPYFKRVHALLASEIRYTPLPADLRARLVEHYEAEIDGLRRLIGRDLSGWLSGSEPLAPQPSELPDSRDLGRDWTLRG